MSESTLTAAAALDAIDEGVLVQDSATQVVYANRAAGELLGVDRDELRGRSEFPTPCECLSESGEALPERWPGADALRTGRPQRPRVMGLPRPDGRVRWVRVSAPADRPLGADFAARRHRPAQRRGGRRHAGLAPERRPHGPSAPTATATATSPARASSRRASTRSSSCWPAATRARRSPSVSASRPPPSACTSATPRASSAPARGPRPSPSPWPAAKSQRHKAGVSADSTWRTVRRLHGRGLPRTREDDDAWAPPRARGDCRRSASARSPRASRTRRWASGPRPAWQLLFCAVYPPPAPVPGPRRLGAGRARHLAVPRRRHPAARQRLAGRLRRLRRPGAHALVERPAVARRLPRLLPGRRPARPRALRAPRRGHVARRPARRPGPRSGHRRHGAAGVALAPRRRRQRRRHRRRLPAGRRRAADLPGHDVRRLELAAEPLGAGARRRPVRPRRRRHDLRDRQRQRRLVRRRRLRPAVGPARCSSSPPPPGCPRAARRSSPRATHASSSRRPSRRSRSACSSTARACA